jgi:hypothetical protein
MMSEPRWRKFLLLWATALTSPVLVLGCDDGKPYVETSLKEAKVSGTVRVKGKPAEGGMILFNASNSGRIVATRSAPIGPDGTYTITTYVGGNQVSFDGDVAAKNRGVGLIKEYVDVQPGENKADFDLMGDGGTRKGMLPFPLNKKGDAVPRRGR